MKIKAVILAVLLVSIFLAGCGSKDYTGNYAAYNQPQQGQPQGQYVGGGCGVAPNSDYSEPVQEIADIAL